MNGDRQAADADLGSVGYLATLIGTTNEVAMRWFVVAVALLLDPVAPCCCHWRRPGNIGLFA